MHIYTQYKLFNQFTSDNLAGRYLYFNITNEISEPQRIKRDARLSDCCYYFCLLILRTLNIKIKWNKQHFLTLSILDNVFTIQNSFSVAFILPKLHNNRFCYRTNFFVTKKLKFQHNNNNNTYNDKVFQSNNEKTTIWHIYQLNNAFIRCHTIYYCIFNITTYNGLFDIDEKTTELLLYYKTKYNNFKTLVYVQVYNWGVNKQNHMNIDKSF